MGVPWSNDVFRGSPAKAAHISTLRDEIQNQANLAGLNPPLTWSWPNIQPGDAIKALYFRDMRNAVQRLWNSKNRGPLPMWSSGEHPGGLSLGTGPTLIRASDITDLRRWLDAYIDNHPRMGMTTKSYDARARNRPFADPVGTRAWIPDIEDLMPSAPSQFMVRCEVLAPNSWPDEHESHSYPIAWNDTDREHYRQAFQLIRNDTGAVVYALLAPTFNVLGSTTQQINEPLSGSFTNTAINVFSDEARRFADYVSGAGVRDFMIWNEPNADDFPLTFQNFAALIFNCYQKFRTLTPRPRLHWGGLFFGMLSDDEENTFRPGDMDYLLAVYDTLSGFQYQGHHVPLFIDGVEIRAESGPWPWESINMHIHNNRGSQFVTNLSNTLMQKVRGDHGDRSSEFMIGEYGITVEDYGFHGERMTNSTYTGFMQQFYLMFDTVCFFSHHVRPESPGGGPEIHWGVRQAGEEAPDDYVNRVEVGRYLANDPGGAPWEQHLDSFWQHAETSFQRLRDFPT